MTSPTIRTRILILSDTHGHPLLDPAHDTLWCGGFRRPLPPADVALHCGDLTLRSTPEELETTLNLMREVDAPLKLVIPGNHDSGLDSKFWEEELRSKERYLSPSQLAPLRAVPQECASLVQKARREDNIHVLLREGTHHFVLPPKSSSSDDNNHCDDSAAPAAKFTIFTSPWTPSYGRWGFQYDSDQEAAQHFAIVPPTRTSPSSEENSEIDVVMTHGPPFGVLDATRIGSKAGCAYLLNAVARARPKVHCFGHIHESAGAALVQWGEDEDEDEAIARTEVVAAVASGSQQDEQDGGIRPLSLCASDVGSSGVDKITFEAGKQTLFVNAAIMTVGYKPLQSPWLVDLDLSLADKAHRVKAEETRVQLTS